MHTHAALLGGRRSARSHFNTDLVASAWALVERDITGDFLVEIDDEDLRTSRKVLIWWLRSPIFVLSVEELEVELKRLDRKTILKSIGAHKARSKAKPPQSKPQPKPQPKPQRQPHPHRHPQPQADP